MKYHNAQKTKLLLSRFLCALFMAAFFMFSVGSVSMGEAIAAPNTLAIHQGTEVSNDLEVRHLTSEKESSTQTPATKPLQSFISPIVETPSAPINVAIVKEDSPFFLVRCYRSLKHLKAQAFSRISQLLNFGNPKASVEFLVACLPNDEPIEGPQKNLVGIPGFDNTINGNEKNNTITGQECIDTVNGAKGNDTIYGGDGNDVLDGENNDDTIYGQDGRDWLYGGSGRDTLYGGEKSDNLFGGRGGDTLVGEEGKDTFWLGEGSSAEDRADILDLQPNEEMNVMDSNPPESRALSAFRAADTLSVQPSVKDTGLQTDSDIPDIIRPTDDIQDIGIDVRPDQGDDQKSLALFILDSEQGRLYLDPDGEGIRKPVLRATVPSGLKAQEINARFLDINRLTPLGQEDMSTVDPKILERLAAETEPARVIDIRQLPPELRPETNEELSSS